MRWHTMALRRLRQNAGLYPRSSGRSEHGPSGWSPEFAGRLSELIARMTIRRPRTWWFIRTIGRRTTALITPGKNIPAVDTGRATIGGSSEQSAALRFNNKKGGRKPPRLDKVMQPLACGLNMCPRAANGLSAKTGFRHLKN
jgi:hypothetical protein